MKREPILENIKEEPAETLDSPALSIGKRIAKTLAAVCGTVTALCLSLIVYPAYIPWFMLFWLVVFTIQVYRKRPAVVPLLICSIILVVKLPDWSPVLLILLLAFIAVSIIRLLMYRKSGRGAFWTAWTPVLVLYAFWFTLIIAAHFYIRTSRKPILSENRPIACIGDSLSSGVNKGEGYAPFLKHMLAVPVVDFSRPGINSERWASRC